MPKKIPLTLSKSSPVLGGSDASTTIERERNNLNLNAVMLYMDRNLTPHEDEEASGELLEDEDPELASPERSKRSKRTIPSRSYSPESQGTSSLSSSSSSSTPVSQLPSNKLLYSNKQQWNISFLRFVIIAEAVFLAFWIYMTANTLHRVGLMENVTHGPSTLLLSQMGEQNQNERVPRPSSDSSTTYSPRNGGGGGNGTGDTGEREKNKVSVVLMNYSRPRMIQGTSLMPTLLSHPRVGEVVLLHANPKTAFTYVHDKVVNVDASKENDEMGLSLRFYFCQMVRYPWVIHVDDDMEPTTKTIDEMLREFERDSHRIVGVFGRNLANKRSFNGYSQQKTSGRSDVVLTKLMLMERSLCPAFFDYAHLVWEDVVLDQGEGPLWNGEDIFMSLVANHVYGGKNNYAMNWLKVLDAPEHFKDYNGGELDISGGLQGVRIWDWTWWQSLLRRNRHYSYRGKLWQTAESRLGQMTIVESEIKPNEMFERIIAEEQLQRLKI